MRYYLVLIFTIFLSSVDAQGFRMRHHVPSTTANVAKAIFEVSPGSYIGGGIIVDSLTGNNQLCMLGLGAQGQVLWKKKYGNGQLQYVHNALITRSFYKSGNHIYYAGCALDINNEYIGVLIKFNLSGDTIWQKIYRDTDPLEDVVPQMVNGSVDGGFLITGYFQNSGASPYSKCMLIKTDANGNELWRKKVAKVAPNTQDGKTILQDSASKKIVIAGYQYIGSASWWTDYANVVILDSLGVKLDQKNYTPGYGGLLLDLIQTKDKKIVAVGLKRFPQNVGGDNLIKAFAVKFDLNAPVSPIWYLDYDQLELTNIFSNIVELPSGDLMLGGIIDTMWIHGFSYNNFVRLTKLNQNGAVIWNRYYDYKINPGTANNDLSLRSLNLTSSGGLIGAIESMNSPGYNPLFFVKWDSTGCDSSIAYCLTQGTVSTVGSDKIKRSVDSRVTIYPNPTNGIVTISLTGILPGETISVSITNISGREVKKLLFKSAEEYYKLNIGDLNNGAYMISMSNSREILYKGKLVKIE